MHFFKSELKLVVLDWFDVCILKKINGAMWLKLYKILKIFVGEMNELYKFEGV